MLTRSKTALSDYSVDSRVLYLSALAAGLGVLSTVAAWVLLKLIGLSTNLFYFHQLSTTDIDPFAKPLHWWSAFIPVVGGLLVGLIARYGSPRVRGHGMPEAVEVIVFGRGRVQPRLAVLKPVATAVAIGSGGPFGAEGPVIMTGGALGSLVGQLLPMTDSERTTLMVAGASAGMAATFSCPLSAVLLAVELLLFEWRPRSLVPVAIACVTGGAVRRLLLGSGPIFPMPPTTVPMHHSAMLGALAVGVVAAFLAIGLSKGIHFFEHLFEQIPIHWMWYPAIGGIVIGLGGLLFPQALGVGYSVIQLLVNGTRRGSCWPAFFWSNPSSGCSRWDQTLPAVFWRRCDDWRCDGGDDGPLPAVYLNGRVGGGRHDGCAVRRVGSAADLRHAVRGADP